MLPLRPNVCMLLVNEKGHVLIGERLAAAGVWQFPQGGVEPELSLEENVIKELNEELGIAPHLLSILCKLPTTHEYEFRDPPAYARGKWRGQSQTFWLVRFHGTDSDIDLGATADPEFSAFRWIQLDDVAESVDPIRVAGYQKPVEEAKRYLQKSGSPSKPIRV